ncbi:MAG TPA: cobalamin-dependent protein [Methanomassiliicoccales archaeon]|nr:cobalamin-dependent protein [Methanomassiliicoccales archaeon]
MEALLLENDREGAERLMSIILKDTPPMECIDSIIAPALGHLGSQWEAGEVAMSQIYQSSKICDEMVKKIFSSTGKIRRASPVVAVACLEDHHMLGIKVVRLAVRAAGYEVIDYGHISAERLAERVRDDKVEYLLISALMLRSALRVQKVRDELTREGCRVTIIVGGAPFRFDEMLAGSVHADFTAPHPMGAVVFINEREAGK